ncbi:peptidoglycan DD-metalloendopeptidase family protein [Nocardia brasiliensis]|uniref:Peptidoglycan DD-metalloendopeptidase family protein n=1 Tax=Nocardia brasiliensis TaxID=37326 RepID=A0A6G9XZD2_NOCBR|nr:M23 family metallopeptidase [Nocardia brasiliensis]QIS06281.1 peptidoglycan DD-metalloendopeptidase family protein [Nocardia brasiliensis]
MNHRSAFASEHRARTGHRYRDDEPSGAQATPSTSRGPSVDRQRNSRFAAPAAAPVDYSARENSWSTNDSWSQQDAWTPRDSWSQQESWSDGAAWNSGESWSAGAAWNSGEAWAEKENWAPEDGTWAPEESWAPEAEPQTPETPATPTVIPGRRSAKRGGAHRVPAPPAALKGRAAVAAVAAGAVVAAGQAALASPDQPSQAVDYEAAGQIHEIAAQSVSVADPAVTSPVSPQILNPSGPSHLGDFNDILQKGQKYAEDMAAAEAAKLRPLFTKFAAGNFTSGFGARWGVQHLGIDVAGPIGTPIVAVADGTVIEAGPASGFGMWVRLLHDDGTVTIYGHIDTATVSQGQRVMAGDQIATIGNRGFSTGPHCHFEVWLNGTDKIDPVPWLATRGISLGPQRD